MHWHSFQDWFFWYFSYRFIMIHWDTINLYLKMWCITKINPASIYVHMAMTIIKLNLVTHMTHYTVTLNLKLTNTTKAANDWHCCNAIIHFFLTDRVTLAGQVATVQCCHSLTQSVTLRCSSIDDSCREAKIRLELWILGMNVSLALRCSSIDDSCREAKIPDWNFGFLEWMSVWHFAKIPDWNFGL